MIVPTVYPAFLKSALRLHLEAKALLNTSISRTASANSITGFALLAAVERSYCGLTECLQPREAGPDRL